MNNGLLLLYGIRSKAVLPLKRYLASRYPGFAKRLGSTDYYSQVLADAVRHFQNEKRLKPKLSFGRLDEDTLSALPKKVQGAVRRALVRSEGLLTNEPKEQKPTAAAASPPATEADDDPGAETPAEAKTPMEPDGGLPTIEPPRPPSDGLRYEETR